MFSAVLLMALRIASPDQGEAYRQPQLAAAHGKVAMTFGAGKAIYVAISTDDGRTFAKPVKVADTGSLALGRHRGPRVAILKDAIVITAVAGRAGAQADTLYAWRSADWGKTWSKPVAINDVSGSAREGLHAMAASENSPGIVVSWLDLRSKGTRLYVSQSKDAGLTWAPNTLAYESPDGHICECCAPSIAAAKDRFWFMWRNAIAGARDMYILSDVSTAGSGKPQKLGTGTWMLNACPMDGGGIAIHNGTPITAWRRYSDIFIARPGEQERNVGKGKDVTIAATSKGVFVAWSKGTALEILTPNATSPSTLADSGMFVSLAGLSDGTALAAWESGGAIQLKRIE